MPSLWGDMARAPTVGEVRPLSSEGATRYARPPFASPPPRKHAVSPERCSDVLGTLRDISHATPDLDGCRQLLELVSEELRAEQAVLILSNPLTLELEFVVHNQDPAVPQRYAEYYCDLDPTGLPAYIKGHGRSPAEGPVYTVSDLKEVVDYNSFVSTEFYNDFLKSAQIHYDLVAFVSPNYGSRGAICLHRARQREPFSDEEIAVLDLIAPFVGNHLERMVSSGLQSALPSAAGKGVIVCDPCGRVLFCNDMARRLCSPLERPLAGPGLVLESCFVGFALRSPDALAQNGAVSVDTRELELDQGGSARLITLESRGESSRFWSESVKERFSLSDREIEVLGHLIAGGLFIAECTVKKHIQSIGAKVGARKRTSIAHTVQQQFNLFL